MSSKKSIRKVALTSIAATAAVVAAAPAVSAADSKFVDVTPEKVGAKHFEAITYLTSKGIIKGKDETRFAPFENVTRSQVALILQRTQGLEAKNPTKELAKYKDVKPSDPMANAVAAVSEAGVFYGKDGKFEPWKQITREQMASTLVRAFDLEKYQDSKKAPINLDNVSGSHKANVQVLANLGITEELENFRPFEKITRQQFASFVYRTLNTVEGVVPHVEGIKAINSTTVEVKYDQTQKVDDVKATKFEIEGLEVKNAAIKQNDDKTVVLTTSAQEGGKTYSVKANSERIGSFEGIAAATPEGITLLNDSQQGIVGKEVTVKAQVKVKEGQSKAGIPVTFNIAAAGDFNKDKVVETVTNEDGVASYSYTQYSGGEDRVVAYATGNADVRASNGKVYWGVEDRLTIKEVTEGNTLANGAKKVYKIKATNVNGSALKEGEVNVAFAENIDVTPDKGVTTAEITDASNYGDTSAKYPFQYTTGGTDYVRVKLDKNGEATFTVTGKDASVTPIVFIDGAYDGAGNWTGNNKYDSTELQAKAPTVKFEAVQSLGLTVESQGVKEAAATTANGKGGRDYKVTLTDKDGKVAPKGTAVNVVVKEDNLSKGKEVRLVDITDADNKVNKGAVVADTPITLTTDAKGQVAFTLEGDNNAFATPTVFVDNGEKPGKLDTKDAQKDGEIVYFGEAIVKDAKLEVKNADGKDATSAKSGEELTATYQSVDQNGKPYFSKAFDATFEVTAGSFGNISAITPAGTTTVEKGKKESVKVTADSNGKATLRLTAGSQASADIRVAASQSTLPIKSTSVNFTASTVIPAVYTGKVSSINPVDNKITFNGYDEVTYSTASFKNINGVVIDEATFEKTVKDALTAGDDVKVSAVKNTDGTYALEIESIGAATPGTPATGTITDSVLSEDGTKLTLTFDKNVNPSSVVFGDFTIAGGGAVTAVEAVSGDKVVLTTDGSVVAGTSTVAISADNITFTDGTSNGAIAATPITQTFASKISPLNVTTASSKAVTGVDASGDTALAGDTLDASVTTTATGTEAAFNGVKIEFKKNPDASVAGPTVSYNSATKTITVLVGYSAGANTETAIDTAIKAIPDHGDIVFGDITFTTTNASNEVDQDDLTSPVTITLAGGVNDSSAATGVYTFKLNKNLTPGDKVVLNGKTYTAGTDFVIASTTAGTQANLATAITNAISNGTEDRFASAVDGSGVITLTDAAATGAADPTLSIQ